MPSLRNILKTSLTHLLYALFVRLGKEIELEEEKGAVLVIAPHPDDETLGCGALLARLRAQGRKIRLVIVTDGSASTPSAKLAPDRLAMLRRTEAQTAARQLGIQETDLVFLSYPDGKAGEHKDRMKQDLAAQIWVCAPEMVLSPFALDAHPDHRAVAETVRALQDEGKIACRLLEYPMWFWPRGALRVLMCAPSRQALRHHRAEAFLAAKQAAFAAYQSQNSNLTGETAWRCLDKSFVKQNMRPFEIFFERPPASPPPQA